MGFNLWGPIEEPSDFAPFEVAVSGTMRRTHLPTTIPRISLQASRRTRD